MGLQPFVVKYRFVSFIVWTDMYGNGGLRLPQDCCDKALVPAVFRVLPNRMPIVVNRMQLAAVLTRELRATVCMKRSLNASGDGFGFCRVDRYWMLHGIQRNEQQRVGGKYDNSLPLQGEKHADSKVGIFVVWCVGVLCLC